MAKKSIIDRNPVLRGLEKAGKMIGKVSEQTEVGRAFHPDPKVRAKFQAEKRAEGANGMAMKAGMMAGTLKNVGGIDWAKVGMKTQKAAIRMIDPVATSKKQMEVLNFFTGSNKASSQIVGRWSTHRAQAAASLADHVTDKRFAKAILSKLMGK